MSRSPNAAKFSQNNEAADRYAQGDTEALEPYMSWCRGHREEAKKP